MFTSQKIINNSHQGNDSRDIGNSQATFSKHDIEKSYKLAKFIIENDKGFKPHYDKILFSRKLTAAIASCDVSRLSNCQDNMVLNTNLPAFDIHDVKDEALKKFNVAERYSLTLYIGSISFASALAYSCVSSFVGFPVIGGLVVSMPLLLYIESRYKNNIDALTRCIKLPNSIVNSSSSLSAQDKNTALQAFNEFCKKLHAQFNQFMLGLSRGNLTAFKMNKSPLSFLDISAIFMSLYQALNSKQEDITLLTLAISHGLVETWIFVNTIRLSEYGFAHRANDIKQWDMANFVPNKNYLLDNVIREAVEFLSESRRYRVTNTSQQNIVATTETATSRNNCIQLITTLTDGFYIFSRESLGSYPTRGICRIRTSDKAERVLPKYTYYQPFEEIEISTDSPNFFAVIINRATGKHHKDFNVNFHLLRKIKY